ncbi:protein NUCLEOLAR FACTOR 1 isoform X2 [Diospyros lotus]|uniref:protein NUCLEOLAR FACTOR 1 isoform X2 n=1 Tax=Diospyros lotus TaxID=55363 RepID=UPI00225708F6|nr:protein NUCLEOLAR FACTOR 1 isoform X2 [Diospyros lotus]
MAKVRGSLARAGKVRGQTLKVAKQEKKKKPPKRGYKGMQYNRRFVTAGDSSEGHSPLPSEEEAEKEHSLVSSEEEAKIGCKEPTMYDNLLKTFGSHGASLGNAYKRRPREEEDKSETEDDARSELESSSELEGEDDVEEEQSEDVGTDDDDEAYEMDEVHDSNDNDQLVLEASASSFSGHLDYKLSEEEVDNLSKRKWKYKWVVPTFDTSNCKWLGTRECSIKDADPRTNYGLKLRLYNHWLDIYNASGGNDFHTSKQRLFFSLCNSYQDILHHNKKPFYLKDLEEDSSVMDAYLMHSLNHICKTRDLITKNDAKVAKHQESATEEVINGDGFLDHGFTRPKVLIILPLASIALRVVKRLIQLTPPGNKVNVEHLDRFSDEFGAGVADDEDKDIESKSDKPSKPSDFQVLFGGNNNDHFMIGIKFTRKSIKLYGDFYSSDMIIASPLGLITKIGVAEEEKGKDIDYLSSIEVLIIDHADVIAMQNWFHVNKIVEQLNCIPSKQHGTDVMRIRQWYLDGHARFYRQTIILGSLSNPDINILFNHHCFNHQGKVKLLVHHKGVLPKVLLQVRQIYERFDAESTVDADDARFEYFSKKVFPKIKDSIQGGIMIFISSFFEFIRVRNFLRSQGASFCLLGEYTKQSDISRARVWFFERTRKIMLYTERAHFYHRYKIRGIQNLIIYSLPERKEFYPEIVNMLQESAGMTCTVLFSQFDLLRLERIVGTASAKRMVTSDKGVFVFC